MTREDPVDAKELVDLEDSETEEGLDVLALDGTAGLKITFAKTTPGAILELPASN